MVATQALLCQEGASLSIFRHYGGLVSQAEARRFYSLNPADFLTKVSSN